MKDYFYGETVPYEEDETGKRFYQFRVGALLAVLFLLLTACATPEDRWLTKEEDAEMRAACEPAGGCALIPNPVWKQIQRALGLDDV